MNFEDSKELSRFIALLLTDGGLSSISGKWRLHFTSNSDALMNEFERLVKHLLGMKTIKEKRTRATIGRVWIKNQVAETLLSYTPSYRTLACRHNVKCPKLRGKSHSSCLDCKGIRKYPPAKIPNFIFEGEEIAKEFVKYAMSADGSVNLYVGNNPYGFRFDKRLMLCCEHPKLKEDYYKLFKQLGFKPNRFCKGGVYLRGRENIAKYFEEIGFVEGVQIDGRGPYGGVEKNQLLELCAKSYGSSPSSFGESREEIQNKLSNILAFRAGCLTI